LLGSEEKRGARSRNWWLAAAAAVVAVVALVVVLRERIGGTARLMALTRDDRIVEPRLSGFQWAPYRGPARAAQPGADIERMKLGGAAGDAAERARRDPSPSAQQTAGVAMLLAQRPEDAVALLRRAAESNPNDAGVWNDLAAAQLVAAAQLGQPSRIAEA